MIDFKRRIRKSFIDEDIKAVLSSFPGFLFCGFGIIKQPEEYRDLLNLNSEMYISFCLEMIKRGVRCLERGAWFISIEHTNDIILETIEIAKESIRAIKNI